MIVAWKCNKTRYMARAKSAASVKEITTVESMGESEGHFESQILLKPGMSLCAYIRDSAHERASASKITKSRGEGELGAGEGGRKEAICRERRGPRAQTITTPTPPPPHPTNLKLPTYPNHDPGNPESKSKTRRLAPHDVGHLGRGSCICRGEFTNQSSSSGRISTGGRAT